jgi:hypothetical protein
MSYWKPVSKNTRTLDNFGLATIHTKSSGGSPTEFYERELGVVLDIVLNDKHPIFQATGKLQSQIDVDRWPVDLEDKPALNTDKDLSWIGRALIRPLISEKLTDKDQLLWAYPLESNFSEYPLINETVILENHNGQLYYTRKVNYHNWPNNNLDFAVENSTSGRSNNELFTDKFLVGKKESKTNAKADGGFHGYAGQYFVSNNKVRTVKRFEGDMLIESRFGQTIHLTAYDVNRVNDGGDPRYKDYVDSGNPMIIIRNRQRPLVRIGQKLVPHKKLPPILGTEQEKNVGGFLEENINHDGSTIAITAGQTISQYVTTCYKKMFGDGEETPRFQGKTNFKTPTLNGDQIVINTDRLVLSSRYGETLHYSKKRYGIVTDSEYTVDAHQQIVLTTNTKTVINSPAIYLGEYDMTNEPALLGQTTVNWLYDLCNWLLEHTHWYRHSHVDAGRESPSQTQLPVQLQRLIALRDRLHTLLSRRVFITGGGMAPGQDGGTIIDGTPPLKISTGNGEGVPGGWKGANFRSV